MLFFERVMMTLGGGGGGGGEAGGEGNVIGERDGDVLVGTVGMVSN